jgi:5-oxopent-3-ene-1,2,5-tricarboxylate decarboxylase / 2-hydroxyhepta-2,4-diene-1,7-dioate isomerase
MKWARFIAQGTYHEGRLVEPGVLVDESGARHGELEVTWLPPVRPGKIIGLALNYADHAEELGMTTPEDPALFFKPSSSLAGNLAPVVYPSGAEYMHYEVELAVVMARRCRKLRAEEASDYIKGYTIANDVTIRDFVKDFYRPPVKAKCWDTFTPLGPYLVDDEIDPDDLELRAFVNGELRQSGSTGQLMRKPPELIEFISEFMTLEENDVILTGTPKGVSHVYAGDVMRLEIDSLGALENPVVSEASSEEMIT